VNDTPSGNRWWTLTTVCIATFMLLLDITVVNVALPDLQKDLDANFEDLQWVIDAYTLSLAAFMVTTGVMADRYGRRKLFDIGLVIFTVASLLCALSQDALMLNLARALQGVGGAIMFATSLALIANTFEGRERGTALGIWGATIGGAVAIGPLVGGLLTDSFGWESIFLINVPIGIACVVVSVLKVEESRNPDAHRIDWPGTVVFSVGLFLLVYGLIRGNAQGWGSASTLLELSGAAVLLVGFVLIETRAKEPMVELSLFRNRAFTGGSIVAFTLSGSMFAMFLYLTLYVQNGLGFSPLETGVRFLPITLVAFFIAPIAGNVMHRVAPGAQLGVGMALVGIGLYLMSGLDTSSKWTALLPGFLVAGAGIGMVNVVISSVAVGVVRPERAGMASGLNSTFRQVGIATGIAALGVVFQTRVEHKVEAALSAIPSLDGRAGHLAELVSTQRVGDAIREAHNGAVGAIANKAFVEVLNELLVIGSVVALLGAACAAWLIRRKDIPYGQVPSAG
jgi:EmrB/QacA subfamily drug resistance transporter